MRFPVVLFDLDGTLIDSGPIILASFRHAASTVLGRELADEELLAHVGGGSNLHEQMRVIAPDRVDELIHSYRAHNEPLHDTLQPCSGILDLLDTLKAEGRRLGIVTAKRRLTVEMAFERLPLAGYFEAVVTSDDSPRHKPDPEPIRIGLERLDAAADEAAYVGDSPFDVAAARAAGVYAVGVTWGKIHRADALADADVVVDTCEDLLGVL